MIKTYLHKLQRAFRRAYKVFYSRSSTYSSVTLLLIGLFAVSLLSDLARPSDSAASVVGSAIALVVCIAFAWWVAYSGKNLSRWAGISLVCAHGVVTAIILGYSTEYLRAVAVLQEIPIMAIYLAWFYPRREAQWTMFTYISMVIVLGTFGSAGYLRGVSTWQECVRLALFMVLAMEVGFRWRKRVDSDGQVDMLTGAITREGLHVHSKRELARAERTNSPLSLAVVDLDAFKEVNDTSGHNEGDRVLASVVDSLRMNVRSTDSVFRMGGDEFVLLLPNTAEEAATKLMTRLRDAAPHPWSWGVTQMLKGDTIESMLLRADAIMYDDKNCRRNAAAAAAANAAAAADASEAPDVDTASKASAGSESHMSSAFSVPSSEATPAPEQVGDAQPDGGS